MSTMLRPARARATWVAAAMCLLATTAASAADTINVQWNDEALNAVRATRMGPPMVARALAIMHTCMFDAWAAYDAKAVGTRFGASLRRPSSERTVANKEKAISYAAFRALSDLFPSQAAAFAAKMQSLGYDPTDTSTNPATPQGVGNQACAAVLQYRHDDGSNQLGDLNSGAAYSDWTGYQPVNAPDQLDDPEHWQPLRVNGNVQKFMVPHWGLVEPFALHSPQQFLDTTPAAYGSAEYAQQAAEVLAYSAGLTDRDKVIAEYWADGPSSETPPGHWTNHAKFISQRDSHDADADTRMYFALANGLLDASIAAWSAKRTFDYVRPVSAVRHLYAGQQVQAWGGPGAGTVTIDGSQWQPYQALNFVTPPFPEFYSGHSVFSAAAAIILELFTGSPAFGASATVAKGSSAIEPGLVPGNDVTLTWATFKQAADEAGLSRRYGGIHFADGDLAGRKAGEKIGRTVYRKALRYIEGSPELSRRRDQG